MSDKPQKKAPPRWFIRLELVAAGALFLVCVVLFASILFDLIVEVAQSRFFWQRAVLLGVVGGLGVASGLVLRRVALTLRPYLPKLKFKRKKSRRSKRGKRRKK